MLIAAIPFLRNLAEYTGDDESYLQLTSLLHHKADTDQFTVSMLEGKIKGILSDQDDLALSRGELAVSTLIFEVADSLVNENTEELQLEDKIVLSIAIGLKAEKVMIREIDDQQFWEDIDKNQTVTLIKRYRADFPKETTKIRLFERVNLMTPENIHINSFMYEPILDMSPVYLRRLYVELEGL